MKIIYLTLAVLSFNSYAKPVWVNIGSSVLSAIKGELPKSAIIHQEGLHAGLLELDSKDVPKISGSIHHKLNRCGGFASFETKGDAIFSIKRLAFWNRERNISFAELEIKAADMVHPMMAQISLPQIQGTIEKLSSFKTRFHNTPEGKKSTELIHQNWSKIAAARSDATVELFQHRLTPQASIILTIKGSTKPEEIVILGAHADSIADREHAPGADDNASGVAAVTEVLRVLVQNGVRPARTIKFIAYAAEEIGLVGSKEIALAFKKQKQNVVGVLQLDMTLFKGTQDKDILLVSDFTNRKQNEYLGKLIDEYVQVPWGYTKCGYGCSDHASWTEQGYPASFPFEANFEDHNPSIHTSFDTIESAGGTVEHTLPFTKLALAFVTEMSL